MSALTIQLENAGKRFLRQWLFRNISLELKAGDRFAITGMNGSGKSTLLQLIAGYTSLSEGTIQYRQGEKIIDPHERYKHISVAAPYLELHDELSFRENISFFAEHKKLRAGITPERIPLIAGLEKFKERQLKFFSSGMKQRVRLSLALSADVPAVFLDEPVANLDSAGIEWFKALITTLPEETLLIICSNHVRDEISFCNRQIDLSLQ